MLDGAARLGATVRAHRRARHGRDRDDRPRQRVRRLRLLLQGAAPPGSSRSSAWRPTSPPTPPASSASGSAGTTAATTTSPARGAYTHMTLLAETTEGMHNLFRLSSRASIEGFFYKPRADRELLAEHAEGLIGTTGCPSGEVQTWLRIGDYDEGPGQAAGDFQDIFGKDNYFLELMDHGLVDRDPGPRRAAPAGQGPRHPADRHQRLPLRQPRGRAGPRAPALRLLGQHDGRPRSGSSSTATATTSSPPRRCASCGASATACRRPATTPC